MRSMKDIKHRSNTNGKCRINLVKTAVWSLPILIFELMFIKTQKKKIKIYKRKQSFTHCN